MRNKAMIFVLISIMLSAAQASALEDQYKIFANGTEINVDVNSSFESNLTIVPARAIFESLNAKIDWNEDERIVTVKRHKDSMTVKIGENKAIINNKQVILDVPAKIENGRLLLPLSFVSEFLGTSVKWDNKSKTISIDSKSVELSVADANLINEANSDMNTIKYMTSYNVKLHGNTSHLTLTALIPKDYDNRQKVESIEYSIQPTSTFTVGNNKYAKFEIDNPQKDFSIDVNCVIDLKKFDLSLAKTSNIGLIDENSKEAYLFQERYLERYDPTIRQIKFSATDKIELCTEIYNYVVNNMKYSKFSSDEIGAVKALQRGYGDCTEFSDLFVTLCRANNIPARTVEGWTGDINQVGHDWAEVYLDKIGWMPVDTAFGKPVTTIEKAVLDMNQKYVYMSFSRNDSTIDNFHYYKFDYSGGDVAVRQNMMFE